MRHPGLLLLAVPILVVTALGTPERAHGQSARERAAALEVPALTFRQPEPQVHDVMGVRVFYLEDRAVPLVNVLARFDGGYARFPRSHYSAGMALPALLRYGGTERVSADSVDLALEYYALQTSFGGGGESVFSSVNTLSEHLPEALALWGDMLRSPRFDEHQVEVWRGREMDAVRRRPDNPQRMAFSEFNRLLYGDHPVGWEMAEADLAPESLTQDRLRELHQRILCRDNLILGLTGDVSWPEAEALLEDMLSGWPTCRQELPKAPAPVIREGGGVFLIPRDLEQSVLVMAHPTDVHLGGEGYFPAQIGNTILGAGGFSSRLLARVRTEEGYAYSAASLWTTPRRYRGLLGAITRTRPENAVPALRLILDILEDMKDTPPAQDEVDTAVDQIANGFVFNFESGAQIVSRRMAFLSQDLPDDWLEQYLEGVQGVTPSSIQKVFREHLRPEDMTILVVGDPERMGRAALESLGPVTIIEARGGASR